ncbi:fibrinogen-like protein A [Apostichopus japonicus]|uniref:fibrinogen-like protein A n=1 Tax=Stichopus japonicus TaxID=307972 RepID=UPI003AB3EA63
MMVVPAWNSAFLFVLVYPSFMIFVLSATRGQTVNQLKDERANSYRSRRSTENGFSEVYYRQPTFPKDCHEIFHDTCDWENVTSGVYLIQPTDSLEPFQVYCNNSIDGGGWTVFQRRIDGSIDFYRNWNDYTQGFGFLHREFWLGNEKLSFLTNQNDYSLRVDVTDIHGNSYFAKYELFRISDENGKYRLVNIDDYDSSSTTGDDKLSWHKNMSFSTYDRDNDNWTDFNCAERHKGAWWFGELNDDEASGCVTEHGYCERFPNGDGCAECGNVHLNADFDGSTRGTNIFWDSMTGDDNDCGLHYTEMKLRPKI